MNQTNQVLTRAAMDANGWISGVVSVSLSELIDNDLEGVLDLLSERLTESGLLCDISYKVVGHADEDTVLLSVSGDANLIWPEDEPENATDAIPVKAAIE